MTFKLITENTPFLSINERNILQRLKSQTKTSTFETPKKEYYEVTGVTYDELYKNMQTEAAKLIKKTSKGDQGIGYAVTYFLSSKYDIRYKAGKHIFTAYPVGLTVQATTTILLPEKRGISLPGVYEKWNEMVKALDKHEQGHVCIAIEYFNKIKQAYLGVNAQGKTKNIAGNNLLSNVKKTYDKIIDEYDLKQKKYDDETNHGSKDAEQEEYIKKYSEDCDKIYPAES